MPKIVVRSKGLDSSYRSEKPWAAISVATKENTWTLLTEENRVGLLEMVFGDFPHTALIVSGKTTPSSN